MKKTLVALAVLAAAGAASAQSSVTLFGVVDAAVTVGRGNVTNLTSMTSGANSTGRIGFRGVEDLGGGLQASFWLEAQLAGDTGEGTNTVTNNLASGQPAAAVNGSQGLTFNRRTTVSLSGNFGEVRLGRDYTPYFWNHTTFDPFSGVGVGANAAYTGYAAAYGSAIGSPITTAVRASNSVGYYLPGNLGGFYGNAQYFFGEQAKGATEDDGTGYGLRAGYAAGPVDVAVAYGLTKLNAGDRAAWNIGGAYNFGVAKLLAMYSHVNNKAAGAFDTNGWLIGASAPIGAGEVKASFSQTEVDGGTKPRSRKFALGYVHNLSKRTAVYTTIARLNNSGGASLALGGAKVTAGENSTGFDLGIRHSF